MKRIWIGIAAGCVGLALGCGGIATEVTQADFERCVVHLDSVAASPERDRVKTLADEGWLRSKTLSMATASEFEREVKKAAKDDVISPTELAALEALALKNGFMPTGTPVPGQAELLKEKRAEEQKRRETSQRDLDKWDGDDVVRERGVAHGWEVDECGRDESDDYYVMRWCDFKVGEDAVRVSVTDWEDSSDARDDVDDSDPWEKDKRDGRRVLTVVATSAVKGRELLTALMTPAVVDKPLSTKELKAALEKHGQRPSDCEASSGSDRADASCDVNSSHGEGYVRLRWYLDDAVSEVDIEVDDGRVMYDFDRAYGSVTLYDKTTAVAYYDVLMSAPAPVP